MNVKKKQRTFQHRNGGPNASLKDKITQYTLRNGKSRHTTRKLIPSLNARNGRVLLAVLCVCLLAQCLALVLVHVHVHVRAAEISQMRFPLQNRHMSSRRRHRGVDSGLLATAADC